MKEKIVLFGKFKTLVAVIHEPQENFPPFSPLQGESQRESNFPVKAVILSNAGLIHRIGPNRIYVKLARQLADQGYLVLRLDLSGVGDSLPRPDHMPVEEFTVDDIIQAMDYLKEIYNVQDFILMGHCAGAYHSIRTATQDHRVKSIVMMNPDGGEAEWVEYDRKRKLARYYANYYGKKSLLEPQQWKRFFTGQISYRNVVKNIWQNLLWGRISGSVFRFKQRFGNRVSSPADEQLFTVEAILSKLFDLNIRVLLIYSEGATSLERAQNNMGKTIKQHIESGKLQLTVIPGADHIFSPLQSQADLFQAIGQWIQKGT